MQGLLVKLLFHPHHNCKWLLNEGYLYILLINSGIFAVVYRAAKISYFDIVAAEEKKTQQYYSEKVKPIHILWSDNRVVILNQILSADSENESVTKSG